MREKFLLKMMAAIVAAIMTSLAIAGAAFAADDITPAGVEIHTTEVMELADIEPCDIELTADYYRAWQRIHDSVEAGVYNIRFDYSERIDIQQARRAAYDISGQPEMFFLRGIEWGYYEDWNTGYISRVTYELADDIDPAQIPAMRAALEAQVAIALSWVSDDWTDVEKAQALHDYLVRTCSYDNRAYEDNEPWMSHTAYGALVNKLPVCQGYGEAYRLLMNRVGIPCEFVISDRMNHGWNLVMIGGNWYHVDVTWDDSEVWGEGDGGFDRVMDYTYFLRSDEAMSEDHNDWETDIVCPCDYPRYDFPVYRGPVGAHDCATEGHVIVSHAAQAPTCTEVGWNAYESCKYCDYSARVERPALGHALIHYDGMEPGPFQGGWAPYDACSRCDYTTFEALRPLAPENGWFQYEGVWYFMIDSCCATGWHKIDGKWYWFDGEGRMATGVTAVDGEYYLFAASGAMATGWTKVDGKWYCADSNGVLMHDAWGKGTNGKWYYLGSDCVMYADGMYEVDGDWYWFDGSGNMLTGWILRDGKWYLSKSATSGKLVHDAWGKGTNGKWYYLGSDCVMYASGKYWVDGDEYIFDASGNMLTGWISYQGEWYHSASSTSGKLQHSAWLKSGSYWYWMDESGVMVHDCTLEIGGTSYEFDAKGRML